MKLKPKIVRERIKATVSEAPTLSKYQMEKLHRFREFQMGY